MIGEGNKDGDNGYFDECSLFDQSEVSETDSATKKDAEMQKLLKNPVPECTVKNILNKLKPLDKVYQGMEPYDDYEFCKETLLEGIDAIKHDYSTGKTKAVKVWLSPDMKTLHYRNVKPGKFDFLKKR